MLNTDLIKDMKMIPLSTSSKIQIIGFRSEDIFKTVVYLAPITGKDEIALDNKQAIAIDINGKKKICNYSR